PVGFSFAPLLPDGNVMKPEAFNGLPDAKRKEITERVEGLQKQLAVLLERIPTWERERRQRVRELDREYARLAVTDVMRDVAHEAADVPQLMPYLDAVTAELIRNVGLFRVATAARREEVVPGVAAGDLVTDDDPRFRKFRVNLLVAN